MIGRVKKVSVIVDHREESLGSGSQLELVDQIYPYVCRNDHRIVDFSGPVICETQVVYLNNSTPDGFWADL